MASSTKNVKLGVCNVLFDGVNLGFTKGGVEVTVATNTYEVKVDQLGETPIDELVTGRTVGATVPLAETSLENLIRIMPGSTLVTDGVKASGTVTFVTSAPVNNDAVTIDGITYTFKTAPSAANPREMAIPATIQAAAIALRDAINFQAGNYTATSNAGVVTVTYTSFGTDGNKTFTKTGGANITLVGASGGVNPTRAKVVVASGTNLSLLSVAKKLILRPVGTNGEDDFVIHRAATAGALNFTYDTGAERVFTAEFKGYAEDNGNLFTVGDERAV